MRNGKKWSLCQNQNASVFVLRNGLSNRSGFRFEVIMYDKDSLALTFDK